MFNAAINSFGLDISELSLKVAELRKINQSLYLQAWNNIAIPAGVIQDGNITDENAFIDILVKLVKNTFGKITTRYAVLCLPENKTFIKLLSVNYAQQTIQAALEEELSRHIPIAISELNYDWQLLADDEITKQADVLVGAAPSRLVDSYILAVKKAGLKPIALEIEAQSVVNSLFAYQTNCLSRQRSALNFFKKNKKKPTQDHLAPARSKKGSENHGKIIIDLGATRSSLILYDHNTIQFTSSVDISGQKITQTIAEKIKLDHHEAEKAKILCGLDSKKGKGKLRDIIHTSLGGLINEIREMTAFYDNHFNHSSPIDQIILTGGGANMPGLVDFLTNTLEVSVVKGYPLENYLVNNREKPLRENEILTFNTAVGLALRYVIINA